MDEPLAIIFFFRYKRICALDEDIGILMSSLAISCSPNQVILTWVLGASRIEREGRGRREKRKEREIESKAKEVLGRVLRKETGKQMS